ncbi:hypothetical protein M5K25_025811 [Dendrobium thyrsiflorum]|uniref:Uncharacterized protein n=1 Tax=Dendrobium thyrsiflorum TaxID=117978 RepID=A0ABD0U4R1_DENTH
MSPDQGSKALLEGSNHNSDYQTISKLDNLIVESSGSTRRTQRAQEHKILTSLSQKIIHRTDPSLKESRERSETALAPCSSSTTAGVLPNHRRTTTRRPDVLPDHHPKARRSADHHPKARRSAGPPPEGPTFCRTTDRRPDVLPDHRLKARRSAGPPPEGPTLCSRSDVLLKARRSAQRPTLCSRPDALLKARRYAQGPTPCSRPDVLLKARRSAQGPTLRSRPDVLLKARRSAQGPTFCQSAT